MISPGTSLASLTFEMKNGGNNVSSRTRTHQHAENVLSQKCLHHVGWLQNKTNQKSTKLLTKLGVFRAVQAVGFA